MDNGHFLFLFFMKVLKNFSIARVNSELLIISMDLATSDPTDEA